MKTLFTIIVVTAALALCGWLRFRCGKVWYDTDRFSGHRYECSLSVAVSPMAVND